MKSGTITFWSNRGHGFITPDDGSSQVFVREGSICDLRQPVVGAKVSYKPSENWRGPTAYHVHILAPEVA